MIDPFENDKEAQDLIKWSDYYIKESTKDGLSKDELINIDKCLSGYYARLNVKVAGYQLEMNTDYWHRKIEYHRNAVKERHANGKQIAQNKADHHAQTEIMAEINQQNLSAYRYEYLNRLCQGIAKVINSVKNRLRWMEIEYQQQRGQT